MRSHLLLCTVILLTASATALAQQPVEDQFQSEIDRAQAALDGIAAKIGKQLDEAFESELRAVRKQGNLAADERQALIAAVSDEQTTFAKAGTIPFSPRMRPATLNYLQQLNAAEAKLAKAYDRAIAAATRDKNDANAAQLAARKKEACRRVVGVWACDGVNFKRHWTWTLSSDGSTNAAVATWNLTKDTFAITVKAADAPKEGFIDKITMKPDARSFTAKNQFGGAYVGHQVETAK